jgi:hypothetical protein
MIGTFKKFEAETAPLLEAEVDEAIANLGRRRWISTGFSRGRMRNAR